MNLRLICDKISKVWEVDIKYYKLNDRIQALQLRVIDADGAQLGVISREEALNKAREQGLDLVEVATSANPPVARIVDFQKFRYIENKKEQAAKKHAKQVEIKEIWLSPRIATHDLEVRLRRVEEFIAEGDKVKLTVKFKGREMIHPEIGHKVVQAALSFLGDKVQMEREVRFEGRNLSIIIGASKTKAKPNEEVSEKKDEQN